MFTIPEKPIESFCPTAPHAPTDAQIHANRANAQHSTGPRTNSGKVKASRNAIRHGITAREIFIAPGEEDEFRRFSEDIQAEFNPVGAFEQDLTRQLVSQSWRLRRIRIEEATIQEKAAAEGVIPSLDETYSKALARLAKYEGSVDRAYKSAYRVLRDLQTNRHVANSLLLRAELPGKPPVLANIARLPKRTQIPLHEFDNRIGMLKEYAGLNLDMQEITQSELNNLAETFAKKFQKTKTPAA